MGADWWQIKQAINNNIEKGEIRNEKRITQFTYL